MDLSQHIPLLCQRQPGMLGIAFKQAALFQTASNVVTQGVGERTELTASRRLNPMEALLTTSSFDIGATKKQHVVIDVEIQRGAKPLDEDKMPSS